MWLTAVCSTHTYSTADALALRKALEIYSYKGETYQLPCIIVYSCRPILVFEKKKLCPDRDTVAALFPTRLQSFTLRCIHFCPVSEPSDRTAGLFLTSESAPAPLCFGKRQGDGSPGSRDHTVSSVGGKRGVCVCVCVCLLYAYVWMSVCGTLSLHNSPILFSLSQVIKDGRGQCIAALKRHANCAMQCGCFNGFQSSIASC